MRSEKASRKDLEKVFDHYGFTPGNEMWEAAMDYAYAEKKRLLKEIDKLVEEYYYTGPLLDKFLTIEGIRMDIKKRIKRLQP
jgi:hypothetical protein